MTKPKMRTVYKIHVKTKHTGCWFIFADVFDSAQAATLHKDAMPYADRAKVVPVRVPVPFTSADIKLPLL